MISVNGIEVKPTIFPDGTSQVWKLPLEKYSDNVIVNWFYENESELIHLNMLLILLFQSGKTISKLYIPYLPYGRQDKEISNETTWAKKMFLELLCYEYAQEVETLDEHSHDENSRINSLVPDSNIREIEFASNVSSSKFVLVYPDAGAYQRYSPHFTEYRHVTMSKVRDQLTGEIKGLQLDIERTLFEHDNDNVYLIVDDICDGGRTFIEVAKVLQNELTAKNIWLYVSHGIFSKGLEPIYESGISRIYTTNSLHYFRMKRISNDFSTLKLIGL